MNSPFACPILSVVYYAGGIKSIPASERKFPKLNLLHKNNTNALPKAKSTDTHDFGEGSISGNILRLAIPMTLAQLINVLYNIIDRIYIGHLPDVSTQALTGIGLTLPVITIITAFTNLFGMGGAPLFSMARGAKEEKKAELILGQVVSLLTITSIVLMVLCYIFKRPVLFLFGASEETYVYADQYLKIYLLGTMFSVLSTGLNGFINAQGYPQKGMMTVMLGAVINLILDPIFIYGLHMGVYGAAIATVISQGVSFVWVVSFFIGKKTFYHIKKENLILKAGMVGKITSLGISGFVMQGTNCLVQIVCNKMLFMYGGDMYVGIMTVINSVREILSVPGSTLGSGAQPVLGYNYGAKQYERVRKAIRFTAVIGFLYMLVVWLAVIIFPKEILSVFTTDKTMISLGEHALKLYFFGFFFMSFQFVGQSTFTALGCAKRAVFFSIFRKVIIVVPLTIVLPMLGLGVEGVFIAEPISNAIGGLASFTTMYFTLYKKLPE